MAIEANNWVVGIKYELREKGGEEILDSNKEDAPLEFVLGSGMIIPGLEAGLIGMNEGDQKLIEVPAAEAYGEENPEAIQMLPREQFEGIDLEKGMMLYGQGEDGQTTQVVVKDFNDTDVTIDFNHPLAGKDLVFDVLVTSERPATEDEAATGEVGGHHHHGGSCSC
jgi:FKBP-type peptidyl-prolyl cis-trans isomerase SlyD